MEIHSSSTVQWQTAAIENATDLLAPPSNSRAEWQGEHPTQPSARLMRAFSHLVEAVRHLGIQPGMTLPVVPNLLRAFVKQVRLEYRSLEEYAAAQGAMDLAFCALILGEDASKDEGVKDLISKVSQPQTATDQSYHHPYLHTAPPSPP